MADRSKIEWTDASWTPIRARDLMTDKTGWHCEHVTTGCEHCYAERWNKRLGTGLPFKPGLRSQLSIFLDEEILTAPLRWKKPRMIFVCSMSDLFADFVPDEWIDRVFAVMALAPQHTFQVLTKRAERMRAYASARNEPAKRLLIAGAMNMMGAGATQPIGYRLWPLPNVWLGISCERQQEANARIPLLLQTPAAVRFVSAEPLLGAIDLHPWMLGWGGGEVAHCENCGHGHGFTRCPNTGGIAKTARRNGIECTEFNRRLGWGGVDWVIVGGESGPDARPMHPDWARSLHDQCAAANVRFFFKQWGSWFPWVDRDREDPDWRQPYTRFKAPHYRILNLAGGFGFHGDRVHVMRFCSKKAAGRLLDGREHNGMPGQHAREAAA